uniref:Dihydrolipoamide acetyltransferase component of pyruvate dehydrogenase complex n=1 Tax=Glossina austeni TaxID=7395 RepID=A0A1A9VLG6_GLOAU
MSHILRNYKAAASCKKYLTTQFDYILKNTNLRRLHLTSILDKRVAFKLSDIGEGIREVTIKEWFVKEGDVVKQFDNLCEVQSDKASVTITSRYDGKILKLHHKIDDMAKVGEPLLDFDVEDEDSDEDSSETSPSATQTITSDSPKIHIDSSQAGSPTEVISEEMTRNITLATPAVRRIAREHKVDLSKVTATGKGGRVLKGDVLEHLGMIPAGTTVPHPTLMPKPQVPVPADRIEQLKGVPRVMFKAMTESLKIPHFAYSDEIEMTRLMQFRDEIKGIAKENGISSLTFMPFFIKAASIALKKHPILNSSLDVEKEVVIYKSAHNISVAIDTPAGLVVPNIKNCQNKNIIEIAQDLNAVIDKGRKGSLAPSDFAGGTFSLSNIGVIGGTYTHPCIMAPQVAIGAMGRTKVVPRFNDKDEVIKAHIMSVSWCADHRVIDGVTMAKFSNMWKNYLENPALFLLH